MIRFLCSKCGHRLKTKNKFANRRVRCSRCGHRMRVPPPEQGLPPTGKLEHVEERMARAGKAEMPPGKFSCPECGETVGLAARIGGRWARCTECGRIVDIPPEILAADRHVDESADRDSARSLKGAAAKKRGRRTTEVETEPKEPERDFAPLLPPHHEKLDELPDYGIKELQLSRSDKDFDRPDVMAGARLSLELDRRDRPLYVFVSVILILYAISSLVGGVGRLYAFKRVRLEKALPSWMQPIPAAAIARVPADLADSGDNTVAAWYLLSGILFPVLAVAVLLAAAALYQTRPYASKLVFWVAMLAIVLEVIDLFITGSGLCNSFKPFALVTSVIAVCAMLSP